MHPSFWVALSPMCKTKKKNFKIDACTEMSSGTKTLFFHHCMCFFSIGWLAVWRFEMYIYVYLYYFDLFINKSHPSSGLHQRKDTTTSTGAWNCWAAVVFRKSIDPSTNTEPINRRDQTIGHSSLFACEACSLESLKLVILNMESINNLQLPMVETELICLLVDISNSWCVAIGHQDTTHLSIYICYWWRLNTFV